MEGIVWEPKIGYVATKAPSEALKRNFELGVIR